jgi:hypothetical protein
MDLEGKRNDKSATTALEDSTDNQHQNDPTLRNAIIEAGWSLPGLMALGGRSARGVAQHDTAEVLHSDSHANSHVDTHEDSHNDSGPPHTDAHSDFHSDNHVDEHGDSN